jgi:hypothetical protein
MVSKSADYALIMHHAVRHVGLKLEGAAGAALSISDMAHDYDHPVPADLNRVKRHEGAGDEREAKQWVIRYAVSLLDGGLAVDGDMVSFAPGKGFDDLTWTKGKVERPGPDPYHLLQNAFSPISGAFAANIRDDIGDLSELRESMKAWGWIDQPSFRALGDARTKVVLIGHRRITVAKELGIDWHRHIDWIDIGDGDAADAIRFKLAIASNIGSKKLSPNDRKRIAQHLYGEKEWTQERIADALNVAQSTVAKDLGELSTRNNSKKGRPRKEKVKKAPDEKQVSRSINTRPGEWDRFKEKAETEGYTVAAKLGEFVRREIAEPQAEPLCICPHCGNQHRSQP